MTRTACPGLSKRETWMRAPWRFNVIVRPVVSKGFPFSSTPRILTGMLNMIRGERRCSFSILHQVTIDPYNLDTVYRLASSYATWRFGKSSGAIPLVNIPTVPGHTSAKGQLRFRDQNPVSGSRHCAYQL